MVCETIRVRGSAGKVVVFGLLNLGGKVYTAIIPNAKTETMLPINADKVKLDSIVYSDTFSVVYRFGCLGLSSTGVLITQNYLLTKEIINSTENFWDQAKRYMGNFSGIKQESFYWFLKECEWRHHQELLNQLNY